MALLVEEREDVVLDPAVKQNRSRAVLSELRREATQEMKTVSAV